MFKNIYIYLKCYEKNVDKKIPIDLEISKKTSKWGYQRKNWYKRINYGTFYSIQFLEFDLKRSNLLNRNFKQRTKWKYAKHQIFPKKTHFDAIFFYLCKPISNKYILDIFIKLINYRRRRLKQTKNRFNSKYKIWLSFSFHNSHIYTRTYTHK